MSNHVRIRDRKRGGARSEHVTRGRKARPKTFKTEESAKAWATAQGISNYDLVNMKSEESSIKKIKVVAK